MHIYIYSIKRNDRALYFMSPEFCTYEHHVLIVKRNDRALYFMSQESCTYEHHVLSK